MSSQAAKPEQFLESTEESRALAKEMEKADHDTVKEGVLGE
jgi:hypothetical protein